MRKQISPAELGCMLIWVALALAISITAMVQAFSNGYILAYIPIIGGAGNLY